MLILQNFSFEVEAFYLVLTDIVLFVDCPADWCCQTSGQDDQARVRRHRPSTGSAKRRNFFIRRTSHDHTRRPGQDLGENELSPSHCRDRSRELHGVVADRDDAADAQERRLAAVRHLHGLAGHHDEADAAVLVYSRKPGVCTDLLLLNFRRQEYELTFYS